MPSTTSTPHLDHVAAVKALTDSGTSKPDAIKAVAEKHGCAVNTVRGAMYRAAGGSSNPRKTTTPVEPVDPIEAAKAIFQTALDAIDSDIESLREAANEAAEALKLAEAGAADKRKDYESRIKALSS